MSPNPWRITGLWRAITTKQTWFRCWEIGTRALARPHGERQSVQQLRGPPLVLHAQNPTLRPLAVQG